jgi:hypothetical protein
VIAPNRIQTTIVPEKPAAKPVTEPTPKAETLADKSGKQLAAMLDSTDRKVAEAAADEIVNKGGYNKVSGKTRQKAKDTIKAQTEANTPSIQVDLADAKNSKDVAAKIVAKLQEYKLRVQKYEDSRGVDEKGKYTYSEPNPKAVRIEVPNGPSYTFQPDLKQIDNAIQKFESAEAQQALKGLAGDKTPASSGSIPKSTNWGPTEKPLFGTKADADTVSMKPDIIENPMVVGPKAATAKHTPKGSLSIRAIPDASKLPADAKHAVMRTKKDGSREIYVSNDPNKLEQVEKQWLAEAKQEMGKYSGKRSVQTGTIPDDQPNWEAYLKDKVDIANTKFAVVGDAGPYKPVAPIAAKPTPPDTPPTGGGTKPAGKKGSIPAKAKGNPTTGSPEGKPKAAAPTMEKPTASTSKLIDLAQKEKDAWDYYQDVVKPGVKAGTHTAEELRAAGKAGGEARAELAKAMKEAVAKGEPIPSFLQKQAEAAAPKAAALKGKGPTSDDIAKMSPEEQDSILKKVVAEFKGKVVDEKGAINPQLISQLGLSVAGAAAGAATTPDDPLMGAVLGGAVGFSTPTVFRAMYQRKNAMPQGRARQQVEKALGQYTRDYAKGFSAVMEAGAKRAYKLLPDYMRASYLARLPNLTINAWAGPYGAATMGAIESAMAGEAKGFKALAGLYAHPIRNAKDFFGDSMREARGRVTDSMERGDIADAAALGEGTMKKVLTAPATFMTAGDIGARKILMKAGFTEPEARALTLTSEPNIPNIGAFTKAKGKKGERWMVAKLMLPFYRTAQNQIEQSALRVPLVGSALRKAWALAPETKLQSAAKGGITGVVVYGSYQLGQETDPANAPWVLKLLNNFTGPYGASASAAFMAGIASQKGKGIPAATSEGILKYITTGLPLPSTDFIEELIVMGADLAEGNMPQLPYGTVPPILSSQNKWSAGGLTRYFAGDGEWARPTKYELGPVPFLFNSKPELGRKPPQVKSEYQRKLEQIKREKAERRKAARESAGR